MRRNFANGAGLGRGQGRDGFVADDSKHHAGALRDHELPGADVHREHERVGACVRVCTDCCVWVGGWVGSFVHVLALFASCAAAWRSDIHRVPSFGNPSVNLVDRQPALHDRLPHPAACCRIPAHGSPKRGDKACFAATRTNRHVRDTSNTPTLSASGSHSLTRPTTHSLTLSFTHSLTHSLTHSPSNGWTVLGVAPPVPCADRDLACA